MSEANNSQFQTPTHSVYYPTATLKQPASKQTVKERTQKYTLTVCVFAKRRRLFTTEGSKQSRSERKNTQRECVFNQKTSPSGTHEVVTLSLHSKANAVRTNQTKTIKYFGSPD